MRRDRVTEKDAPRLGVITSILLHEVVDLGTFSGLCFS